MKHAEPRHRRILITGGAGFIGSAVIAELQRYGHDICVIDDLSFGNRSFISVPDHRFHQLDILDRDGIQAVVTAFNPEWVIHLAAVHFIPWCNAHPYLSANINIQGTMNVLDVLRKTPGVGKVFFASTAAVYPIFDGPLSELHPTGPTDIYGLSKLAGERLIHEFHLQTRIPSVVCRFFNAFGPNETNPHLIPEIQRQILEGRRTIQLGNMQPKRDFIHTFDMAKAVRALMESFEDGYDIFNLGRGEEYAVSEIVASFSRAIGEEISVETDPARVRPSDRLHLLADISKLCSFSGWVPQISLDAGIATLVKG